MWEAYNSRIKFEFNDGSDLVLPIDTLRVHAEEYVPEGGTLQELVGGDMVYVDPTYRYVLELEYQFERTRFRSSSFATLDQVLFEYARGNYPVDVLVRYDEENGTFNSTYKCINMLPDVSGSDMRLVFEQRQRQKERKLTFKSGSAQHTFNDVRWVLN